jgi:hypothetical protein
MRCAPFVGALLLTPAIVCGVQDFHAEDLESAAAHLRETRSAEALDAVVDKVENDRIYLVESLRALLHKSSQNMLKARACFLIGQFHGLRASDELINNVDVEWTGGRERYPCRDALIKSGRQADRFVLMRLAVDDDPARRGHLVRVIVSWYGRTGGIAKLQEAIRGEGVAGAKRLADAVKIAQAL